MTSDIDKTSDPLERLAASIADDEPIDWQEIGASRSRDLPLEGLREMQQLVQGYRHLQLGLDRDTPRSCRFCFGPLNVIEPLGSGSQSEVWRAYDPMLDLQVALKLRKFDSTTLAHRFLEEAKCLARIRHANIVSVYGAAVDQGRAGLWTELIRGDSLGALMERHGPFPVDEIRGIGQDVCHALAAVHRHGLLHGDIKADNVMREISGRIVLMDFGAAGYLSENPASVVTGTLNYLAPEVLAGAAPSVASDIYALGVLLFHLLSGVYPYAATDVSTLLNMHGRCERLHLHRLRTNIPQHLVAAIDSALQIDPKQRPSSALAFAARLAQRAQPYGGWGAMVAAAVLTTLFAIGIGFAMRSKPTLPVVPWQTDLSFRRLEAHNNDALSDGVTIALGDHLALEFRTTLPTYVYVFDDDGSADAAVLFPLDGIAPTNPLAADVPYRLPGKAGDTALTWQVSSNAARETFIVVAADVPQTKLETLVAGWRHAGLPAGPTYARGALNLVPSPVEASVENAALHAILADLDHNPDNGHVRTWRFVFPHTKL